MTTTTTDTGTEPVAPTRPAAWRPGLRRAGAQGRRILILVVLAGVAIFLIGRRSRRLVARRGPARRAKPDRSYIGPLVFGTIWPGSRWSSPRRSRWRRAVHHPLRAAPARPGPGLPGRPARRRAQRRLRPVGRRRAGPGLGRPPTLAGRQPRLAAVLRRSGLGHRTHDADRRHRARRHDPADHHRGVREVFLQTPKLHEEAALALGATRWEMIRMAVLPFGRSGVISGAMLGLGRALGETMAVAMVLSVSGAVTFNLISSATRPPSPRTSPCSSPSRPAWRSTC